MDAPELLDLFDRLAGEVALALRDLDDWGPSGQRVSQYRHDVVADDIIVGGLTRAGLAILSEESGIGGDAEVTVVVDPVDGSTNASRRVPWYAVSLCAVDADGPLAALVLNLATGDRYRAMRGRGARHDHSAIRVPVPEGTGSSSVSSGGLPFEEARSVVPRDCDRLDDAIIGFSGRPPTDGGWRQFRVLGAAALDLCAVADGTLDGYIDIDRAHGVWDYLGALLVCREAGVTLVDSGGEDLVVLEHAARRGPVAGATAALADQLLALTSSWT
ncbi:MAG: inositol monophosphatase family protein [Actinomycetota bacterium]